MVKTHLPFSVDNYSYLSGSSYHGTSFADFVSYSTTFNPHPSCMIFLPITDLFTR